MAKYLNCTACPNHEVISDRDPHDWFCDDDKAVICKLTPQVPDFKSEYLADHSTFKPVVVSCRPYNVEKEAVTPKWCPLRSQQ